MAPLLLALMLSVAAAAPQDDAVRITIARVESPTAKPTNPEFAIEFGNPSDVERVVLLGLKNGTRSYPMLLVLLLTDSKGQTSTLRYRLVRISGVIAPYLLPLNPHGSDTLRIALSEYSSPYTGEGRSRPPAMGELDPNLPADTYTIKARLEEPSNGFTRNMSLPSNLWRGTASSNVLRFSVP
jgi:hypothetical protein